MSNNAINNKIGDPTNTNPLSIEKSASGQMIAMNDQTDVFGYYNNAGSPEGVVAANIGSLCTDTTNGELYIKQTDTVNTGWVLFAPGTTVAFYAFLPTSDLNQTGSSADYVLGSGNALTVTEAGAGGNMSTGGTFTAPVDGFYCFTAKIRADDVTVAMDSGNSRFMVNGTDRYQAETINVGAARNSNDSYVFSDTAVFNLTATDTVTVECRIAGAAGNTADMFGGALTSGGRCDFGGFLIASSGGAGPIQTVNIQTFTSSGTYTPTAGMVNAIVEVVGGGGGGGGCNAGVAGASGGGSGGYARGEFSSATIGASQIVTIGAGGAGSAVNAVLGTSGGTTSVGALISATGGGGGRGDVSSNVAGTGLIGGTPGTGVLGDFQISGERGGTGSTDAVAICGGGFGGSSIYGGGGAGRWFNFPGNNGAGNPGNNYGSGGGGAATTIGGPVTGGAGSDGLVVVTEYIS